MLAISKKHNLAANLLIQTLIALVFFFGVLVVSVSAQAKSSGEAGTLQNKKGAAPFPQGYKNIKIGMTAPEVREKLGKPESEDAGGMYFSFSDSETAQILLDNDKKVRVIVVMFMPEHPSPMKFEDAFGKDIQPDPATDGRVYKMIRYPDAGYWVAYNRLAGDKSMITLTIQKM